ncbi:MAG: cupin domain-containing protein [Actinomycetota bacterium]
MTPTPIDLNASFDSLDFLPDRAPDRANVADGRAPWFDTLARYRDGAIFIVHYAGDSQWERHPDDELVMVIEGGTTMTLVVDGAAVEYSMTAMQMIVVPARTWHRFHTPDGVKVMTITPQPTDHQLEDPDELVSGRSDQLDRPVAAGVGATVEPVSVDPDAVD